jgi:hypothetical protein
MGRPRLLPSADRPARVDRFPNFHRHVIDQGAQLVTHHAKATAAGSTEGSGSSRSLLRRAFAARGVSSDAKGGGARSNGRLRAALAVLALAIAAFAIMAAPALGAPLATQMETISNASYTSAHVTGTVTSPGGGFTGTTYSFQYSTNPSDPNSWSAGLQGNIGVNAVENKTVQGEISVPKGSTEYFVRLYANTNDFLHGAEEAVSPEPSPHFTTLPVAPPVIVATDNASAVLSTSASASGKVKRPANADPAFDVTTCRFEYVANADFVATGFAGAAVRSCDQATPFTTPEGETGVSAQLGCANPVLEAPEGKCLEPATTYHLRLAAENAAPGVVTKDAASTFTTAPKVAEPVILATDDAFEPSTVSPNASAKASGEVQRPAGVDPALDTSCRFEYVTDEQFTATGFAGAGQVPCAEAPATSPLTSTDPTPVTAELTGLAPATTYHLRLAAENGGGVATKDAANTFITPPEIAPTVSANAVVPADIGYTITHLSGTIDPGTHSLFFYFEWAVVGTEDWINDAGSHGFGSVAANSGVNNVVWEGTGFSPGSEYKVRIHTFDQGNRELEWNSEAPYHTFTAKGTSAPPIAVLDPLIVQPNGTAHFSGTIDPNAPAETLGPEGESVYKTAWHFECTPDCSGLNGEPVAAKGGTVEAEAGSQVVSADVARLQPNTFYEVRLIATDGLGTTASVVQTFQTPLIAPTVSSTPGGSDGRGGYFLEGIVNSNNTKVTSCKFEYGTTATYPNTYEAPCLPSPSGPNEVQLINVEATEGQFKLSFRGQTTADLPYDATPAEVQTALRALSQIGATGVNVTGIAQGYKVTFAGSLGGTNVAQIHGTDGTTPLGGGAGVSASTETEGGVAHAVSVEAHLEALTVGSTYHFRIFATSAGGSVSTVDRTFIPTLDPAENCPNTQLRKENSSLALPECRAYEMVTPPGKEGWDADLTDYSGGDQVGYHSGAANIAKSGQAGAVGGSVYVATRKAAGWETIPNLNGSSGTLRDAPSNITTFGGPFAYSEDLLSSLWYFNRIGGPALQNYYHRDLEGAFTLIGPGNGSEDIFAKRMASADLSHLVLSAQPGGGEMQFGRGVYEFIGTGNDQPDRVDLDNSGSPVSSCIEVGADSQGVAISRSISTDGRTIVFSVGGGCGGGNPPANEIWARVNGTTSVDITASHCNRADCNAPANPTFLAATPDASRVFFTTTQQLVNGDTDQTKDIYACDLPAGTPAPVGQANPCAAFTQVSDAATGAEVQRVVATSEDGSTVYFTAKGALAANEDALEERAVVGDENLYVWRQDAAHPAGQTIFVGRLAAYDLSHPQTTSDGRYLVFTTANPLVATDTDTARDVYRYDAVAGEMTRVSTGVSGTGGNAEGFDATIGAATEHNSHPTTSDDGQKIIFVTTEALSPLDGNGEPDVYLWTPGRVFLISTGAVGDNVAEGLSGGSAAISSTGQDIYFNTTGALTPSDGDDLRDVYDARIGGGFSFAQSPPCSGEACRPPVSNPPASQPLGSQGAGPGNPTPPKPCPKGKVRKHGKCVKKAKKHSGNRHHAKKHKRASSNSGGGK